MKVTWLLLMMVLLLATVSAVSTYAQQQPMFTQYMFNGLVLNPAYAGAQETFTATAMMRRQWSGIAGAPQTQTFSAHSPLDNMRPARRAGSPVSVGLVLFHDQIAITSQTGLMGAYAYRIKFSNVSNLSMGLQAGVSHYSIRYSDLELDDPAFAMGDAIHWQAEFGAGVYYRYRNFFSGVSAPQMLRPRDAANSYAVTLAPHLFLSMGYVFDVSASVKVKPHILIKSYRGVLNQVDLNCNAFMNEVITLGLSWRSLESLSALFQLQVNPKFAVGYAYDHPYNGELAVMSNGSHEIMVSYTVPRKNITSINPRFF